MPFYTRSKFKSHYQPVLVYDSPARVPSVPLREQPMKYASLVWIGALISMAFMAWGAYEVVGHVLEQVGSARYH